MPYTQSPDSANEQAITVNCLLIELRWARRHSKSAAIIVDWDNPETHRLIAWGLNVLRKMNTDPALIDRLSAADKDDAWRMIRWYLPAGSYAALINRLREQLQKQGQQLSLV